MEASETLGDKHRFRFSKTGRVKYISHLDLMATMRRAILRAGVRLKYSEGFNPHPFMSAAMPLSVGHESVCELMDVGIADEPSIDGLPAAITAALPEGIEVLDVYKPERKFSEITWVEIRGLLHYDKAMSRDTIECLTGRFKKENIIVSKKTKRGSVDLDIAPFIRDIEFSSDCTGTEKHGIIRLKAKISAQNPTINPENLMSALDGEYKELAPCHTGFKRIEIYDREMKVFR